MRRSYESIGLQMPRQMADLLQLDRRVAARITAFCAARSAKQRGWPVASGGWVGMQAEHRKPVAL